MSKDSRQELGWRVEWEGRVVDNFETWILGGFPKEWKVWWRDNFQSRTEEFSLQVGRYLEVFV